MRHLQRSAIAALGLSLGAAAFAAQDVPTPAAVRDAIGHLGPVPAPEDNPVTPEKVQLGRVLFSDTALSGDGSMSCRTCHLPDHGFATPQKLGPAYPTQHERRNSPTLINVAYNLPLIWDGRAGSLDKQALGPIKNVLHMNNDLELIVEQLKVHPEYPALFEEAFGGGKITAERMGQAIASYERTLVFDGSPLDRYMDGDAAALTDDQKQGLALFMGKARCIVCHKGPNLTDNKFHTLGAPDGHVTSNPSIMASIRFDARRVGLEAWASLNEDPGRWAVTRETADRGAFRTMGLRNIADSPPYMHNGALATLEEVVDFYNRGGGVHPNKSKLMEPLDLTRTEVEQLVEFLETALAGSQRPFPTQN